MRPEKLDSEKSPAGLCSQVPLAPLTTFGVGGKARFFLTAHSIEEVAEALDFARTHALSVFVLGGGSNILVADDGFDGLVLKVQIAGITFLEQGDEVLVTVGAGVVWDDFVVWAITRGWSGMECLSGIPGTVGGAVVANIGAYGAQCSDTFVSAEVIDMESDTRAVQVFEKEDCHFSYHDSIFSHVTGRYVVVRATFALTSKRTAQITYRDNRFNLSTLASSNHTEPTLLDVRDAVLAVREEKGMLCVAGHCSYKSAGSFFHMAQVSSEVYRRIVARAQSLDREKEERLRPWAWQQSDGSYKVAPGFLLEYTSFQKGYVRGAVGISPKHTLSIINVDGARASDITRLAHDMDSAVQELFGVTLEREVEYIGAIAFDTRA